MKRRSYPNQNHPFHAVKYKHDLGQHFLFDTELLRFLVHEIGITIDDHVLEIGAGTGTLTRVLCETAARVTAIEVDEAFVPLLQVLAKEFSNLEIIWCDIRKVNLLELQLGVGFKVAANIPYSITSQIFDLFWGKNYPIAQMSVMVQKEVADKLTATPGDKAYGLMSVRCRYYCDPKIIAYIPASAFTPPPKVDSAFVNLTFRKTSLLRADEEKLLWKLVKASYRLRRKTLLNALKTVVPIPYEILTNMLDSIGLPHTVRGEVLNVAQWIDLTRAIEASWNSSLALKPR